MIKTEQLSSQVANILNEKMAKEYSHHYFYQSASNWCKASGFNKAAEYFLEESNEELGHARKIADFLNDWNVTPKLPVIETPILEFKSLVDVIENAYENEYELYEEYEEASIDILQSGDVCAFDFLQFYRKAQTDSVKTYSDMINLLEGVDPMNKLNLLLLEQKLF